MSKDEADGMADILLVLRGRLAAAQLEGMTRARLFDRVRLGDVAGGTRERGQLAEVPVQRRQVLLGQRLDVDQPVARTLHRSDELVQLQVNRQRVLVLRTL